MLYQDIKIRMSRWKYLTQLSSFSESRMQAISLTRLSLVISLAKYVLVEQMGDKNLYRLITTQNQIQLDR